VIEENQTIDYTETFSLFPENWGDVQQNIGWKLDISSCASVYSPEILPGNQILTIKLLAEILVRD
jgi:hypothetical protein